MLSEPVDYHLIVENSGPSLYKIRKSIMESLGIKNISFNILTSEAQSIIDKHAQKCIDLINEHSTTAPLISAQIIRNYEREISHTTKSTDSIPINQTKSIKLSPIEPIVNAISKGIDLQKGRYGWIYVGQNPAFDHLLKIGKTTRAPRKRISELSGDSGTPFPMSLVFEQFFSDVHKAEREIHARLSEDRVNKGREWFKIIPVKAIDLIRSIRIELEGTDAVPSIDDIKKFEGEQ